MTYKQLDEMREIRMWTVQIIMPGLALAAAVPEIREPVIKKFKEVKAKTEKKIVKFKEVKAKNEKKIVKFKERNK